MKRTFTLVFTVIMTATLFSACDTGDLGRVDPEPKCSLVVYTEKMSSYDFGYVEIGSYLDVVVTIEANLEEGESISGSVTIDCKGFTFWNPVTEEEYPSFSYDLGKSDTKDFTIRFEPTEVSSYSCVLDLDTDCGTFQLSGFGQTIVEDWTAMYEVTDDDLLDIFGNASGDVWACGDSGTVIVKPFDVFSWTVMNIHDFDDKKMRAIWADSESNLYLGGGDISVDPGRIYYKENGGSWEVINEDVMMSYYSSIWGAGDCYLFFGGMGLASIGFPNMKFYDCEGWGEFELDMGMSDVKGIWGTDTDDAWAVLDQTYNNIYQWNGTIWTLVHEAWMDDSLKDVWVAPTGEVFAVGANGAIYRKTESQWYDDSIASFTSTLHAVWGSASDDVYAAGEGAAIYYYDGNIWQLESAPTGVTDDLFGLWGTGAGYVYAVGAGGTILYRSAQ